MFFQGVFAKGWNMFFFATIASSIKIVTVNLKVPTISGLETLVDLDGVWGVAVRPESR